MDEYIEKNKAIKELYEVYDYEFPTASGVFDEYARMIVPNTIKNMPAADVAPVRHGRWENGNPICPVCGGDKFKDLDADIWCDWQPAFCPNCGAKMDGGRTYEYIEIEALMEEADRQPGGLISNKTIQFFPAADVVPVRHGRWEMNSDRPDNIICTNCDAGFDVWKHEAKDFNYCPNCGADMRKGKSE